MSKNVITYTFSETMKMVATTEDKGTFFGDIIRIGRLEYGEETESKFYSAEHGTFMKLMYKPGTDIFYEENA